MKDDERTISVRRKPRPALGIVTHQVVGAAAWWRDAAEVARAQDVDLFIFNASNIGDRNSPLDDAPSALHRLVSSERLDSLVLVQWWPTREVFEGFYNRNYRPLPVVNVHRHYGGYPGVSVDNREGMATAIRHLIEVHGYRRLAYIGGLPDNPSANERYQAYVMTLEEYGIPLDPTLVLPGDFSPPAGTQAMQVLMDERGLRPVVDFEAVVASNDNMALTAMAELQRRDIRVPLDVAVVGFDDSGESRHAMPSLTTVHMPNEAMGRVAAEMALAAMRGEPVTDTAVPAELVVRQSCGCFLSPLAGGGMSGPPPSGPPRSVAPEEQRAAAIAQLTQVVGSAAEFLPADWAEQLLDAFLADIERPLRVPDTSPGHLLPVLHAILRQFHLNGYDLVALGRALLIAVRNCMRPTVTDVQHMRRAESQWQEAMAFVADVGQQARAARIYRRGDQIDQVRIIGEQLINTFDLDRLLDLIARELPRLDIPSCYVVLYEGTGTSREEVRLVMAYNEQGRNPHSVEGQRYNARKLLPDGLLSPDHPSVFVITALYFQEVALGFALFEVGSAQGEVYETLARQISSALMGSLLVRQQDEAQRDAESARQRAQAALSDLLTTRSISDRVRQAADTEAILRVTLEALSQALGASTAVARLGTREQLLDIGAENTTQSDTGLN
ncbi:MAG: LacI family DNA-binding transcriptional regulator [Anaerolineae bacterium]